MPGYWAIRSDRDNQALLLGELRAGRLRQGWGYYDNQDLHIMQAEAEQGGDWWARLTDDQRSAWGNLKMLGAGDNSVQVGDVILVPNLPEYGYFMLVRVTGPYRYEPLQLADEHDVNDLGQDYGHILPVSVLTPQGINRYADDVDASIRTTLRTPMRMWNLGGYSEAIEQLVTATQAGADTATATTGEGRLATAWESALSAASETLNQQLGGQLDIRFQAAEWEEPIKLVLQSLYPKSEVIWTGGPYENGADLVLKIPDHFGGGLPWIVLIQVKNYADEIGSAVLEQLRTAYNSYRDQGKILSLVAMTTAETASDALRNGADALEKELGVSVEIILRKRMLRLLSDGLMERLGVSSSGAIASWMTGD